MKTWTVWLSGALTAGILVLAVAAGWRAAPGTDVALPADARWRDGRLTREFESHYDAVFPARTLGINLWGAISYRLFNEGKPGVVVGRDGWLFTQEEFIGPPDGAARVQAHLDTVATARERLAAHGTALLVALVPAKARVYPEFVGARRPDSSYATLYAHALGVLQSLDIPAPDLLAALGACKSQAGAAPMFLRTDTHWTPDGARCAARRLAAEARARRIGTPEPARYRTEVESVALHRGDLMKFLPLDPWFAGWLPPPDRLELRRTAPRAATGGLLDETPPPQVVLVGTSFSADPHWNFTGALQEALGEDVANYAAPAQGPFRPMLDYLDSADLRAAPPRLVVWEIPERYLPMRDDAPISETQEDFR